MDLTQLDIRSHFGFSKPIHEHAAAYSQFGPAAEAGGGLSWERTDLAEALKKGGVKNSIDQFYKH